MSTPRPRPRHASAPAKPRLAQPDIDLAATLAEHCRREVVVLSGRRMEGSSSRLDHIAIAPGGVWVLASGRCEAEARVLGRLGEQQLWLGGRDYTDLVVRLGRQVRAVATVVDSVAPNVRTLGAVCIEGAVLPYFRTLAVRGFPVLGIGGIVKRLDADGPVDEIWSRLLADELATAFPAG